MLHGLRSGLRSTPASADDDAGARRRRGRMAALLPAISSASSSVRVIRTLHIAPGPLAVSDDGAHVWVVTIGDGTQPGVTEINARSGRVVRAIEVGLGPFGVDSDGRLRLGDQHRRLRQRHRHPHRAHHALVLYRGPGRAGRLRRNAPVGHTRRAGVRARAASPSSTSPPGAWCATSAPDRARTSSRPTSGTSGRPTSAPRSPGHSVTEIDERTGRVVRTIGTGLFPIAITSDGARVYVATAQGLVTAINARTGHRLYTHRGGTVSQRHRLRRRARVGDRRRVRPRRRTRSRATAGSSRRSASARARPASPPTVRTSGWPTRAPPGPGDTVTELGVRGVRPVYRYGGT